MVSLKMIDEPLYCSVQNNNDKKLKKIISVKNQTIPNLKNNQRSFTCEKVTNLNESLVLQ